MLRLMSLERPPTAVFSCNYNMTVGALRLLQEHGLSVPDDLSLVELRRRSALLAARRGDHRGGPAGREDRRDHRGPDLGRVSRGGGATHEPHTITLNCDIILRGSTRRRLTPDSIVRPET